MYARFICSFEICVYICVVLKFTCPSISWTLLKSAPPSNKWVAKECRNIWGLTWMFSLVLSIILFKITLTPLGVRDPPWWFNNNSLGLFISFLSSNSGLPKYKYSFKASIALLESGTSLSYVLYQKLLPLHSKSLIVLRLMSTIHLL